MLVHRRGGGGVIFSSVHSSDSYSMKYCVSFSQTTEDGKQEKKNDQPPQAKKPKVKTKTVELAIENNLHWQLSTDVLNLFVENEVMLQNHQECLACPLFIPHLSAILQLIIVKTAMRDCYFKTI